LAFEKPDDARNVVAELVRRMNEDRRRIKIMEQDMERVRTGVSSLENAALAQMAEQRVFLERMNDRVEALSARFAALETAVAKLGKEVGKAATKMEVRQIESFIDIVNPITSKFVTKDELDRAIEWAGTKKAASARAEHA
jgi:hypothetical protein